MSKQMSSGEIIQVVSTLRDSDEYIKTIFTEGGCYQFYIFVKSMRADAIPLINKEKDHVVVMVDNVVFDIEGIKPSASGYKPMTDYDHERAKKWSFSRNKMLSLGECKHCGEPILI